MRKNVLVLILCCCCLLVAANAFASTPVCDGAFGLKWEASPDDAAPIAANNGWSLAKSAKVPDPDLVPTWMQQYKGEVSGVKANITLIFDQNDSAPMSLYFIGADFSLDSAAERQAHYAAMLAKLTEQFGPPIKQNPANATYQMAEWSVPWQKGSAQVGLANTQMGYSLKYKIHGPRFAR